MEIQQNEHQQGFKKNKFKGQVGETFDCIICQQVARLPQECTGCGSIVCKVCFENLQKETGLSECLRCQRTNIVLLNESLYQIYNELELYCDCGYLCKMRDFYIHQNKCQYNMPKCQFNNICHNNVSQLFASQQVCGPQCLVLQCVKKNEGNWNVIYQELKKLLRDLRDKQLLNNTNGNSNNNNLIQYPLIQNIPPQQKQLKIIEKVVDNSNFSFVNIQKPIIQPVSEFSWDPVKKGNGIVLSNNNMTAYLQESYYVFKSVISNLPFMNGQHYWEIIVDQRTENELKIGISLNNVFNFDSAFCDYDFGYGFYTVGQLRSSSNAAGGNYGKKFKNSGVCGCFLDMNAGTLTYSLNGESLGLAFTSDKLKKGPIYPSVSLLHHAGFTLISNKPIPAIFKN